MAPATPVTNPLDVLIVGCGNIAGGFDAVRPPDALPVTHAGAFTRDGRFRLAACVDPDDEKREAFRQRWRVPVGHGTMGSLTEAQSRFDVVSICSPTSCHANDVRAALQLQPRLILCEKPVSPTVAETEELVRACSVAGVQLAINHVRRWDSEVRRVASDLAAGVWGAVRTVSGLYNKGVLNNGSHMIDLLHRLLGPVMLVHAGKPIWDGLADDPSVPAHLIGADAVPISLGCGHAADYALFELQLVTAHGVISMETGGMWWRVRKAVDSQEFRGYRVPESSPLQPGGYSRAMLSAVGNIHDAVMSGAQLASTGDTALAAQRICELIKTQAAQAH